MKAMSGKNSKGPQWISPDTRDMDILKRHEAGESHQTIANEYGITRERVRQIIESYGGKPRRQQFEEKYYALALDMKRSGMTVSEAKKKYPWANKHSIRSAVKSIGYKPPRVNPERERKIREILDRVAKGESARHAAGGDNALAEAARRRLRSVEGLRSKWKVSNHRADLIVSCRLLGMSWRETSEAVGEMEGKGKLTFMATRLWAERNMTKEQWAKCNLPNPERRDYKSGRKKAEIVPRKRNNPVTVKRNKDVVYADTVRETAILNYRNFTASELAAALGVTRNCIIGHWYRARQTGEIKEGG